MARIWLALWLILMPFDLFAQDADKGFVTNFLEENLGGEGRTVEIFGFQGALSSRATIERIIISDDDGIWLTMEGVGLQWTRSALLRGRVEIQELSANLLELARLPVAPESDIPAAEASGFSLPELPVSIAIELFKIDTLALGAPVLGNAAELSVNGTGQLGDGAASVMLEALRSDGQVGAFQLEAAFDGRTDGVELDLSLTEAAGGIAAGVLDLPGQPSVDLQLNGSGTLNDLKTTIALRTDGAPRLEGEVVVQAQDAAPAGAGTARRFEANLGGDITALFAQEYRPFFGERVSLNVSGLRAGDGALDIEALTLDTEALRLRGAVALNRDFWPTYLDVSGQLAAGDEVPVLLPLSGPETYVTRADFVLEYDQADGDAWNGRFDVIELTREGLSVAQTLLAANGILEGDVNAIGSVSAGLDLTTTGLDFGDSAQNAAVGETLTGTLDIAFTEGQPITLSGLDLSGADYTLAGDAVVGDLESGFETAMDVTLNARDLSRFSAVSGQDLRGSVALALKGTADLGGAFDLHLQGTGDALAIGQAQADAVLAGRTRLAMQATRSEAGLRLEQLDIRNAQIALDGSAMLTSEQLDAQFDAKLEDAALLLPEIEGPVQLNGRATQNGDGITVDLDATGPHEVTAAIEGLVTGPDANVAFDARLPDVGQFLPQYQGAVALSGRAMQSPEGWRVETAVQGPYALHAEVAGRVTGEAAPDLTFEASLPDIAPLVPQVKGAVTLQGSAQLLSDGWQVTADVDGPYGLTASTQGRVTGQNAPDVTFTARLPDVSPLAPQFRGALAVQGSAQMNGETLNIETDATGPYGLVAQVSGTVTGQTPALTFSARVPNIKPIVGQLDGPLSVSGTARQQGQNWFTDTNAQGPAGTVADIVGRVGADGQLGVSVAGTAPLSLANPFLAPRNLQGQSRFNMRVDGPPVLGSVTGQVQLSGGRLSAPTLGAALTDINGSIDLSGGRATVAINSAVSSGGTLTLRGPVTLSGGYPADLDIALNGITVVDPSLYRTTVNGGVQVAGNLVGGARITGRIDVGETKVSVPSTGLGGFSIIPKITHRGASAPVRATQKRAGLLGRPTASSGTQASYPLDILISAPSRIFVRGRGLDAELGGSLRLTGTTANVISSGRFELIRGRLDILEKRFVLDEGNVQLQGGFNPFLRFVATTNTTQGTASVIIEGPASAPEVRFEASPEAPDDEVLAQIFFGRQVTQLSAFQALQLASAVATLAGRGGEGVVSKLRRGFDLDDLDIATDAEGQTALTAGKYISDNVYTDVTVGGADGAEASINIDLTPNITLRGGATATGDTSVGIYYEKDY